MYAPGRRAHPGGVARLESPRAANPTRQYSLSYAQRLHGTSTLYAGRPLPRRLEEEGIHAHRGHSRAGGPDLAPCRPALPPAASPPAWWPSSLTCGGGPARRGLRLLLDRALCTERPHPRALSPRGCSRRPPSALTTPDGATLDPFRAWEVMMAGRSPVATASAASPSALSTWRCGTRPRRSWNGPSAMSWPSGSVRRAARAQRAGLRRAAAITTRTTTAHLTDEVQPCRH